MDKSRKIRLVHWKKWCSVLMVCTMIAGQGFDMSAQAASAQAVSAAGAAGQNLGQAAGQTEDQKPEQQADIEGGLQNKTADKEEGTSLDGAGKPDNIIVKPGSEQPEGAGLNQETEPSDSEGQTQGTGQTQVAGQTQVPGQTQNVGQEEGTEQNVNEDAADVNQAAPFSAAAPAFFAQQRNGGAIFTAEEALNLDNWINVQNKERVSVEGDTLKISTDTGKNVQISPNFQVTGATVYQYDFKITSGSLGLQFNMKQTGTNNWDTAGYIMNVSQSGHVDLFGSNGTSKTTLGTGQIEDFKTNDFNRVAVTYQESGVIEVSFNDKALAQALIAVTDTKQPFGYFGLVAMGGTPQSEVKNFTVEGTKLSVEDTMPTVFSDDFSGDLSKWESVQGSSSVADGKVTSGGGNFQLSPKDLYLTGDAVYEFDVNLGNAGAAGLQFNMKDKIAAQSYGKDGLYINLRSGNLQYCVGSDSNWKNSALTHQYDLNTDIRMKIVFSSTDQTVTVYLNDQKELELTTDKITYNGQTYLEGYCGLVSMSNKAQFSNFRIKGTAKRVTELPTVFEEDFSGDLSKWKLVQNTPAIVDGRLTLNNTSTMQFAPAENIYYLEGDAEYEFDVSSFANGAAGIQFNMASPAVSGSFDAGCYYINLRKTQVQYCKDGVYKTVNIPAGVDTSQNVHVKIIYESSSHQILLYLNDELTLTWTEESYTGGYFGFISMGTMASFDNIVVRGTLRDISALEFEKIVKRTSIIYKPLRDQSQMKFPSVPDRYQIKIDSTSPQGYIDTDGTILKRPDKGTGEIAIDVTFTLTDQDNTANTVQRTLSVPLSPVYDGPLVTEEEAKAERERFEEHKYGLFVHYVAGLTKDTNGNTVSDIDVLADDFDAAQFAKDVNDMGFEYVIFTVAHSQQRNLYPSETMKRWRDDRRTTPGVKTYTDDVDVVEELYQALAPYDIDLHLYLCELDGLYWSAEDRELTGWDDCGGEADGDHERYNQFQVELADEMASRYAGKVKGFWFDGYFIHGPAGTYGPTHGVIDQDQYKEAFLAYDPGLALVGNVGTNRQRNPYPEWTSLGYRCQELYNFADTYYNPDAKNDDGRTWTVNENQAAQVVANSWWATNKANNMKVSKENLFLYVVGAASLSKSGGVALAMGCFPGTAAEQTNGNIWEGNILSEFTAMNQNYISPIAESIKNTKPGQAYTTKHNSWLAQEGWGVSTESKDGKNVYLHIITPPADSKTISIPETEDRSVLGGKAQLLKYDGTKKDVTIKKTDKGYDITLPDGEDWHELDTVIKAERVKPANPDQITFVPGISDEWTVTGNWEKQDKIGMVMTSRNDSRETSEANAQMSFTFEGNIVEVNGNRASNYGRMEILIDGTSAATVDCASSKTQRDVQLFKSDDLGEGSHTITLKNLDSKNMAVYGLTIRKTPVIAAEKEALKDACERYGKVENNGVYTPNSWTVFDAALTAAKDAYDDPKADQDTVDRMVTELEQAYKDLVRKGDPTSLQELVKECDGLKKTDYTAASWAELTKVLDEVRPLLKDENISVTDMNKAYNRLVAARLALSELGNTKELDALIERAQAIDTTNIRPGKAKALADALAFAIEIQGMDEPGQKQINDAADMLLEAIINLKDIVNRTELMELTDILSKLKPEDYTSESYGVLTDAIRLAESLDDDSSDKDIREAYQALQNAFAKLKRLAGESGKSALRNAVQKAEYILAHADQFMPNSITGLAAILNKAKGILDKTEATQQEVDEICKLLSEENGKARVKEDKEVLLSAIQKAALYSEEDYTPETYAVLKTALAAARNVAADDNATKEQIGQAAAAVEQAVAGLSKIKREDSDEKHTSQNDSNGKSEAQKDSGDSDDNRQASPAQTGDPSPIVPSVLLLGASLFLLLNRKKWVRKAK